LREGRSARARAGASGIKTFLRGHARAIAHVVASDGTQARAERRPSSSGVVAFPLPPPRDLCPPHPATRHDGLGCPTLHALTVGRMGVETGAVLPFAEAEAGRPGSANQWPSQELLPHTSARAAAAAHWARARRSACKLSLTLYLVGKRGGKPRRPPRAESPE